MVAAAVLRDDPGARRGSVSAAGVHDAARTGLVLDLYHSVPATRFAEPDGCGEFHRARPRGVHGDSDGVLHRDVSIHRIARGTMDKARRDPPAALRLSA